MIGVVRVWTRTLVEVLASIFPESACGRLPGIDRKRLEAFLARLLREGPWDVRFILYVSAALFLVTPLLTVGRFVPALALGPRLLRRHGSALAGHRIYLLRQVLLMLKTTVCMYWGADPDVRRSLGYRPYDPDPGTWRVA